MACDVITYCQSQLALGATETAVRGASARLFKDSKRIEALVPCLDVLLVGNIENQTTFRVWARQHCDTDALCIYTGGMPSPAWRAMYLRLLSDLPISTPVLHWGDVDEGGFRIASVSSRWVAESGHALQPWRMRPSDVPESLRRAAPTRTVERMAKYAHEAGWNDLARELVEVRIVAEQEG